MRALTKEEREIVEEMQRNGDTIVRCDWPTFLVTSTTPMTWMEIVSPKRRLNLGKITALRILQEKGFKVKVVVKAKTASQNKVIGAIDKTTIFIRKERGMKRERPTPKSRVIFQPITMKELTLSEEEDRSQIESILSNLKPIPIQLSEEEKVESKVESKVEVESNDQPSPPISPPISPTQPTPSIRKMFKEDANYPEFD